MHERTHARLTTNIGELLCLADLKHPITLFHATTTMSWIKPNDTNRFKQTYTNTFFLKATVIKKISELAKMINTKILIFKKVKTTIIDRKKWSLIMFS